MSHNLWWTGMIIRMEISKLTSLHAAICKWHGLADAEFNARLQDAGGQEALDEHSYDTFANEAFLINETERVMCANLAVSINSCVENYLQTECRLVGLADGDVPTMWRNLGSRLGFTPEALPGYKETNKARILGNKFKHNSGNKDVEFVAGYGGIEGQKIEYEGEDWAAVITGAETALTELTRWQESMFPRPRCYSPRL